MKRELYWHEVISNNVYIIIPYTMILQFVDDVSRIKLEVDIEFDLNREQFILPEVLKFDHVKTKNDVEVIILSYLMISS